MSMKAKRVVQRLLAGTLSASLAATHSGSWAQPNTAAAGQAAST